MKWVEIIELRSVESKWKFLEPELKNLIEELNKETQQQTIKIYDRVAINGDISIHLFHESKEADINGSSLGLQLIANLKEYGLTNHSIWIEKYKSRGL